MKETIDKGQISSINTYGNIWVHELLFVKKGDFKGGHKHDFDHVHFVSQGSVKISKFNDDEELTDVKEYIAPMWIKVPKNTYHKVEALEDMTLGFCIEALRDGDGQVIESHMDDDTMDNKDTTAKGKTVF